MALERLLDRGDGDVRESAALAHVLHVAPAGGVVRVEQRVLAAIELERPDPEAIAESAIEGGRGFDPSAVEIELGVAVIVEDVGAHLLPELRRAQVIAYIGE